MSFGTRWVKRRLAAALQSQLAREKEELQCAYARLQRDSARELTKVRRQSDGLANFRPYQFDMARRALYENKLVSLPTGLGKTLIASSARCSSVSSSARRSESARVVL